MSLWRRQLLQIYYLSLFSIGADEMSQWRRQLLQIYSSKFILQYPRGGKKGLTPKYWTLAFMHLSLACTLINTGEYIQ